jgi:hypothetical protein
MHVRAYLLVHSTMAVYMHPGLARNQASPFPLALTATWERSTHTHAGADGRRSTATNLLILSLHDKDGPAYLRGEGRSLNRAATWQRGADKGSMFLHPGTSTTRDAELPIRPLNLSHYVCIHPAQPPAHNAPGPGLCPSSLAGYIYLPPPGYQTIILLQTESKQWHTA